MREKATKMGDSVPKGLHQLGERILWKLPDSGVLPLGSPQDSAIPNFDLYTFLPDKDRTSFPTSVSTTPLTIIFQQVPYGDELHSLDIVGRGTLKFEIKKFQYLVENLEYMRSFLCFHL